MTSISGHRRVLFLAVGDLIAYIFSLILTLTVRYGSLPHRSLFYDHIPSFAILFVLFLLISFSAGLYDKQLVVLRGRIEGLLLRVQAINFLIGIVFFYFAPVLIAPKANLFIYIIISTVTLFVWRRIMFPVVTVSDLNFLIGIVFFYFAPVLIAPKANLFIYIIISTVTLFVWRRIMFPVVTVSRKQVAIIVGAGEDIADLFEEINTAGRYEIIFEERIEPSDSVNEMVGRISEAVNKNKASVIVANLHDPRVEAAIPFLYSLIFSGVQIIDAGKIYESIFDRIPLSMVGKRWLIENSGTALGNRRTYDILKRFVDIVIGSILGIISLVFYPLVYLAIRFDDRG